MHVRSPSFSRKSVYLHCEGDCEFPEILYHPTIADTHCANKSMNIPYSNTLLEQRNFTSPNTLSFLKRK